MDLIDVKCGECGADMQVGSFGGKTECPACKASLNVPPNCPPGTSLSAASEVSEEPSSSIHSGTDHGFDKIAVPSSIAGPDFSQWGQQTEEEPAAPTEAPDSSEAPAPDIPDPASPLPTEEGSESVPAAAPAVAVQETKSPVESTPTESSPKTQKGASSRSRGGSSSRARSDSRSSTAEEEAGVPRKTFLMLVVYASIMTALALGMAFLLLTSQQRQLESLPDVVPQFNDDGEIARVLVPMDAELPPGHRLRLGASQRFGDLKVTPLRVTREPLEFSHYQGKETRDPAGEVLKLWVKFENVGDHARGFTPLDGELLFYRVFDKGQFKANNFLAEESSEGPQNVVAIFDQSPESDWDLVGQKIGTVLKPGETWETYAPSEVDPPAFEGPLVWRLHLRKGIADNGWGVTTLVEVEFDASQVEGNAA